MDVGCLGKIVEHERLSDGRFNIVLLGWKRVRLNREKSSPKLYRIAEAEILEDQECGATLAKRRSELIGLFRDLSEKRQCLDDNFRELLDSAVPLGVLSDIIANALRLPSQVKQALLAEPHVKHRVETLCMILRHIIGHDGSKKRPSHPHSASIEASA